MADDDFVAVFRLVRISTMDVFAEGRLNSSTVLKNLQSAQICHCRNTQQLLVPLCPEVHCQNDR